MRFARTAEKKSMSNRVPLYGLILGGGRSLRMGREKSDIEYHGKPQRDFLFDLLTPLCDDVYFSCKNKSAVSERLHPLEDAFTLESPLNGILTAFRTHANAAWLSVPVDMPNVNDAVMRHLLKHRDATKTATCFFDSEGKNPEPLLTLWEPSAGIALADFFRSGKFSPRAFLMTHEVHIINVPDPDILININSADELKEFKKDVTPGIG